MPDKLKKFLFENIKKKDEERTVDDNIQNSIDTEKIGVVDLTGHRNDTFVKLGGILRKKLNRDQLEFVLQIIGNNLIDKPIPKRELMAMLDQIEKYKHYDKEELAKIVFDHLKIVEEGSAFEISTSLRYEKKDIEHVLKYLVENERIYKKGKVYKTFDKAQWKDTFIKDSFILKYKIPYFFDHAVFRNSDMIVIGAKPGAGKSHIALNILKQFIDQGIKPYYINLESGNRFVSIATKLGLKEKDFYWCNHYNPEQIELEKNSVTIIDWLLPNDYAQTDKLYKRFTEQLDRHKGLLIIFVQLKKFKDNKGEERYDYFAPNMLDMFPSFVCKYLYKDTDGINSFFETTKIRESRTGLQHIIIPTTFNPETKILELKNG